MKIAFAKLIFALLVSLVPWMALATPPDTTQESREVPNEASAEEPLPNVLEARGRARLLHEAMHATLQVVHHRYFREDEGIAIPAQTLKRVFAEIETSQKVQLRWLAVNAQAMNVDHEPRDDFDRHAVESIVAGKAYELAEKGVYRRAAVITLKSECLKCHLPNRKDTNPRAAGLVISMPFKSE